MRSVGIVGGGQLGRMLIQAGIDLDLHVKVLDAKPDSPCAGIAHEFVVGSVREAESIESFAEGVEILTIELEDVSVEGLLRAAAKGVEVYPAPQVLSVIQDKGRQRAWYASQGFPSPRFQLWMPGETVEIPFPLIQKAFQGGYDGKGVQRAPSAERLWQKPSLLEEEISIYKELSVIVARSKQGEVRAFPVVESVFHPEAHVVEFLRVPAEIPSHVEKEAREIAMQMAVSLNIIGLLAVEFFYSTSGQLYVNEAAPRPHNTGHITIKACWTSQFEQHWRALLGLPLGETRLHSYGALLNILGPVEKSGKVRFPKLTEWLEVPGVSVHLYGKRFSKPFRKLGHIIILAESPQELLQRVGQVRSNLSIEIVPFEMDETFS
ncbi:MAG: 5-(carboxyamino)imidazole ribonucleotide synthase [Bacteroidia bacterium]|nr:5-(carboxyamino)imidazole ribonucleotide synthase [Bacteroidia bacterium]MDW8134012.1 5-(carboxyamino)imidazole ribonucleotide synthase [Bacteroidia bacterium]